MFGQGTQAPQLKFNDFFNFPWLIFFKHFMRKNRRGWKWITELLLKNGAIDSHVQGRSQKCAMGGAVLGVWGRSPQPPEANGGLGAKPPAAESWGFGGKAPSRRRHGGLGAKPRALENFAFFCKNNFILGLFWLKNNVFKTWLRNWQCKHDKTGGMNGLFGRWLMVQC